MKPRKYFFKVRQFVYTCTGRRGYGQDHVLVTSVLTLPREGVCMCVWGGGGGGGGIQNVSTGVNHLPCFTVQIYILVSVRESTSYMYSTSCAYQACLVAYWTKSYIRQVCISDQLDWMSDCVVYHVQLAIRPAMLHIRPAI